MKLRSCPGALLSLPIPIVPIAIGIGTIGAGSLWLCSEWKICRPNLVCDRIAPKVEPSATSREVHPTLSKPALGISTDMKVFRPLAIGQGVRIWIRNSGLSAVMELGFVAQTTVRTRNVKHKNIF